jgi:hypothetical protein
MVFKIAFLVAFPLALFSQGKYANITIDIEDGRGYAPCEPSISIIQNNPAHVVAGAILDKVYFSTDSGKSWREQILKSKFGVFGDPCVITGPGAEVYYFHLSDPAGKGWSDPGLLDRIVCQRSDDYGKTWTEGSSIGFNGERDQDKEWAIADPQSGNVYVTWTEFMKYGSRQERDSSIIMFAASNRKALKWKKTQRINQYAGNCVDSDQTVEGAVPAVGPKGEIYVSWAFDEKIWFDRSLNKGKTWMKKDGVVADIPGGWDFDIPGIGRCNGMPVTCCDLSNGPNRGTIYVNWSDQRNGPGDTDIWISKSTDGGENWSAPLRVNDDAPGKQQFFTWMDIDDKTGYIYVVFYDRRNHPDLNTDVYLAVSKDGGNTFDNILISREPFEPTDRVFFGDYNNISVYDGMVRPIWTHYDGQKLSIKTAIIRKP